MDFILLAGEQGVAENGGGILGMLPMLLITAVMFVVLYFVMIRPQRKKQKEEEKMRNNIQIGDEILTIGGFYYRVVSIKEDSLIVESVSDHSKQKIARWAVQQNMTVHEDA
jgi:preprotein translocase subunit YajC